MTLDKETQLIIDLDRACSLAELAGHNVGVTLKYGELRFLLSEIERLQKEVSTSNQHLTRIAERAVEKPTTIAPTPPSPKQ